MAAVGLVGDLCRALQSNILPFCDEVMQLLLENLGVSVYTHNLIYRWLERWLNIKIRDRECICPRMLAVGL